MVKISSMIVSDNFFLLEKFKAVGTSLTGVKRHKMRASPIGARVVPRRWASDP